MKKVKIIISILMVFIMVFSASAFATLAEEEIIKNIDFGNEPMGNYTKDVINADENSTVTVQTDVNGSKYLDIVDKNEKATVGLKFNITEQVSVMTVSFDYKIFSGSKRGGIFYISAGKSPAMQSAFLNNIISAFDGAAGNKPTDISFANDTWVRITSIIEPGQGWFTLYLDGQIAADRYKFRNEEIQTKLSEIMISGDSASVPTHIGLKNIKVVKGAVVPKVKYPETVANAENIISNFDNAEAELKEKLSGGVALVLDYPIARKGNEYVRIDNSNTNVRPISVNSRTLVPVRFIAESLGAEVSWDEESSKVTILADGKAIELVLGDKKMKVDSETILLDTPVDIYHDRIYIPLRAIADALGKELFWDDRGLIVISGEEAISESDETLIRYLLAKIKMETSTFAGGQYSDVYMSSRSFRWDGRDGQWGTWDALKRFMATGDKWSYITQTSEIKGFRDMGLTFQGAINANMGVEDQVKAVYLDGTKYQRADGIGAFWSCSSSPYYLQYLKDAVKAGIDKGVTEWQFDDWALNTQYLSRGGCFCDYCMEGFTKYLMENCADKFAEYGINDINSFNYKNYLKEKGISTTAQYLVNGVKLPIHEAYKEYQILTTREMHRELKEYMDSYAKRPILYTHNVTEYATKFTQKDFTFIYDLVDGGMGETSSAGMLPDAIMVNGMISNATGKQYIISPLPRSEAAMETIRNAIAFCYATGQFILIPWDTWLEGSTRYFAATEELEGLYWFVRQYPELFNDYEAPAEIGIVCDFNNIKPAEMRTSAFNLFKKGVSAKALITKKDIPNFYITEEQAAGLDYIVGVSDISKISQEEQDTIHNSGATVVGADNAEAMEAIANAYWKSKIESSPEGAYSTLRENTVHKNAPKVLHVVNCNELPKENLTVEINNKYLFGEGRNITATIYAPGKDPLVKYIEAQRGITRITIDNVDRWAVVSLSTSETEYIGAYNVGVGFSGIGLGTRPSDDRAVGSSDNLTMISYGTGLNVRTDADKTGTQDEGSFVYKNITAGKLREYSVSAKIENTQGTAGVMVRTDPTSNAKFVALIYDGVNGLRLAERKIINKSVIYTNISNEMTAYLKLARSGGKLIAYISEDGTNYKEVASSELNFTDPLGGVFSASADGKRSETVVSNLNVDNGQYPADDIFKDFTIGVKDNQIGTKGTYYLDIKLETTKVADLGVDDVDITFNSDNEGVLKVLSDGRLIPVAEGTATVTAVAKMGCETGESKAVIKVVKSDPAMYRQDFNGMTSLPDNMSVNNPGIAADGEKLLVRTNKSGAESDVKIIYNQLQEDTVFEFDFRAIFGKEVISTGARVAYIDNAGISVTADPCGFNYFFGTEQTKVMDIEEGKWYKVKIVAKYSENTADVYIDDKKVVDSGEFRKPAAPSGNIQIGGWRLGMDSSYEWDNLVISSID